MFQEYLWQRGAKERTIQIKLNWVGNIDFLTFGAEYLDTALFNLIRQRHWQQALLVTQSPQTESIVQLLVASVYDSETYFQLS